MSITAAPLLGGPLSIELMNTIWADTAGVYDELAARSGVDGWLRATAERTGWTGGRLTDDLAVRLRELRAGLRRLAEDVTGDGRDTVRSSTRLVRTAVAQVNLAAAGAPRWAELHWREQPTAVERSSGSSVDGVLARIAGDAVRLFGGPGCAEVRACYAPGCVLYFLRDRPRREWCSPACGNRARVARHYARHHPTAAR